MIGNTPLIKLQVEGLTQSMTAVVAQYHDDIQALIEDGVKREMANFNYQEVIEQEVRAAIKKNVSSAINAYFSHGKGRELVDSMVVDILNGVIND